MINKALLIMLILIVSNVGANDLFAPSPFLFPIIGKDYLPQIDVGYSQYETPSLKGSGKIVLTFDDGPHPTITPAILDVLKEYQVKATFFILGENVNARTLPIVERILKEGHFLASHDFNHDNKNTLSKGQYRDSLEKAIRFNESLETKFSVTQKEAYYRFPYADYGRNKEYHHFNILKEVSQTLYGENCLNFVFWEIDSADWVPDMTSKDVYSGIVAQLVGGTAFKHKLVNGKWVKSPYQIVEPFAGGIILLHDIQRKNIESVRLLLDYVKKTSFEVIPLNQVEGYNYDQHYCVMKE